MPKPTQESGCHPCITQKVSRVYPHDFGYVGAWIMGRTRGPASVVGQACRGEAAVNAEARLLDLRIPGRSRRDRMGSGSHDAVARGGETTAAVRGHWLQTGGGLPRWDSEDAGRARGDRGVGAVLVARGTLVMSWSDSVRCPCLLRIWSVPTIHPFVSILTMVFLRCVLRYAPVFPCIATGAHGRAFGPSACQRECVEVERQCRVTQVAGRCPCWTDGECGALRAECALQR